ncbi:MAG: LamG domain-containing protein, partial [Bacteroidota bacterium]
MTDPLYKNTTLLLQADDAANGAQNNTFLDSSPNAFAITRNGNTTQGSFTPFSLQPGAWSNFASAASASVGFSNATAALVGSTASTFTAECWIYMTDAPVSGDGVPALIGMDATFNSSIYLGFGPNASQKLVLRWFDGASKTATGNTTLALNTWYHIAVVANSNALAMYVNGVPEVLTGTTTLTNRNATTNTFSLFLNSSGSNYQFRGYASNIRVCTSAVYTSAFTPSTTPLTTTSQGATNCRLLTSQNNLFIDNSSNAYTLTLQGAPSVQAFSPFAPQFQWTPSVIGGSGYFDGTTDYLTGNGQLSSSASMSTFTVEGWLYPTTLGNNFVIGDM